MLKQSKWLLLTGILWSTSGAPSRAADLEADWKKMDAEEAVARAETAPKIESGSACRDGKCAPSSAIANGETMAEAKHPPFGSYMQPLAKWLCYRAAPNPPCCKWRPTQYHPPLYTYFPCKPAQCACATGAVAAVTETNRELPPPQPVVQPVPMPIVPRYTQEERPLIPGSSAAFAERRDSPPLILPPLRNVSRDE